VKGYELYRRDPIKGYQLIGVLPERRSNSKRITKESVTNWGKIYFGKNLEENDMFFFQLMTDKNTGRISRTNPFFII
jgi:hypothetical protein